MAGDHRRVKIDFQRALTAPAGAQEVLLVRHGACDPPAVDGLIGGRSDPSLNERGRGEAEALTRRLGMLPLGALFTTPLRRTGETAAAIAAARGLEPEEVPDLVEVFLGEWEGHGIHDRGSRDDPEFARVIREQRWELIPGAEPAREFAARVRRGIEHVADAVGDGEVAVAFTHAAVIAELLRQVTGSEPFAFMHNANGSVSRLFRMPDRRWVLVSFNETQHLPG
ncbi:MAG: 2,3-bisphosphoglycerate-dependent phosphoglycerate mutase [Solirubrobacterales bacterium]|nr:2,3-bisphosphoglycerate-dependent phosphoglycerate mutase [Solirubrobacterales bacterium]